MAKTETNLTPKNPETAPQSQGGIVPRVESGFADALRYDAHRPYYPSNTLDKLLSHPSISCKPGAHIVDLAAGTDASCIVGKAIVTGQSSKRYSRKLSEIEDGWADAVLVAQAFHWFANMESLEEIRRILKPNGLLGLTWNLEDYNTGRTSWEASTDWEDQLREIIRSRDTHDTRSGYKRWSDIFNDSSLQQSQTQESGSSLFQVPLENFVETWTIWLRRDALWDRYRTLSQVAVQEEADLKITKARVFEILHGPDVEINEDEQIAVHGHTETFWTTALPKQAHQVYTGSGVEQT